MASAPRSRKLKSAQAGKAEKAEEAAVEDGKSAADEEAPADPGSEAVYDQPVVAEATEKVDESVPTPSTGTEKKFMPDKGFGFIAPDDGSEDVFVHINECNGAESLREGDAVTFDSDWNYDKGKSQKRNCTVSRSEEEDQAGQWGFSTSGHSVVEESLLDQGFQSCRAR